MRKRHFALLALFSILSCKKKEIKDTTAQPFYYKTTFVAESGASLSNNGLSVKVNDTAYVYAIITPVQGIQGIVNIRTKTNLQGVQAFLSVEQGIPPFEALIKVVANDTALYQNAIVSLTMSDAENSSSGNFVIQVQENVPDTFSSCTGGVTGPYIVYKTPNPANYVVSVDSVAGRKNLLILRNIDSIGDSATAHFSCTDQSINIPFQRLGTKKFISGSGHLATNGYLNFDVSDFANNIVQYSYSLKK